MQWDELVPASIGILLGLFGMLLSGRVLWRGRVVRSWTQMPVQIVSSRVSRTNALRSGQEVLGVHQYYAAVQYRYVVDSVEYTGTRVQFGERWAAYESAARDIVGRFPAGGAAVAMVNPSNPQEATLLTGSPPFVKGVFFVAAAHTVAVTVSLVQSAL